LKDSNAEYTAQYEIAYNTPNYQINSSIVPDVRPVIYTSPYILGCTSYSIPDNLDLVDVGSIDPRTGTWGTGTNNAGTGMRIDGNLVDGYLRSMVLDSFTQVNQGGRGVHILNHGYAQFVSIFTVATKEGVIVESGGSCSISTSNSTFGLSGLIAKGKSPTPILYGNFKLANSQTGQHGYLPSGNLFTINNIVSLGVNPDSNNNVQYIANFPYTNMCFTVGDDQPWGSNPSGGYIYDSDLTLNGKDEPKLFFVEITPRKVTDVPGQLTNAYDLALNFNIPFDLSKGTPSHPNINFEGAPVKFYARSMIETGSHTFEYIGTGTRMYWAMPANGGVANNYNEAVFDANQPNYILDDDGNVQFDNLNQPIMEVNSNLPGVVFYTSSNELGDFKVGPSFKILQSTGTIDGDTFKRAILTLVTPLNIVLE
jgi:hypothetical protein